MPWASEDCHATWCVWCRTCARPAGWRCRDRILLHVVGLDAIAEHFDFIAREVLAVSIVSGPGEGAGFLLELDDDLLTEPALDWTQKAEPPIKPAG